MKSLNSLRTIFTGSVISGFLLIFCIVLLSGCENFMDSAETKQKLDDAIAYANAESYTITFGTSTTKGTVKSPAGGEVQKKVTDSFAVNFSTDEDFEFLRWKIVDSSTGDELKNGEYLTLSSVTEPEITCTFKKAPAAGMKLCLIPVEAERPQIISNTPQNGGILKDSSIQVLFDHDMDENSIYYTEAEVIALRKNGIEDSNFLPALAEDELSGNLENHYGYIKNGLTYYKNISLTNKKTGENLNDKFGAPVFEDESTLTIPASKEEGKTLDDYTHVLVTIEKGFFYSEKIDETTSKPVTLRGIKKWSYQITNHGDEDALVFQKKNGNDVFTLKLNEEAEQSLDVGTAHPVIGEDGNGIGDLIFIKSIDEKPTLYCNMALQDVAGGTGPNSTFTVCYERIKDYITDGSGTDGTDSFDVKYSTTTSEDAIFTGYLALELPSDGTYRIWFDFTDRSQNHFYYPTNANEPGSNEGFYVTKDVSSVSEPSNIIVKSGAEKYEYKLSWADPQDIDYDHTVITVVTGETETSNTVNKGEEPEATINNILPKQSYVISITHYDYAGNKISSFPKFLTGFSVSGTPSFSIADNIFFKDDTSDAYNLTVTAYYSDGDNSTVSSTATISSDVQNTKGNVTFKYTEDGITQSATFEGAYYIASSGAKPTEKPVKLTDYSGTLSGGTYYKFGDFPQTISDLSGENAYTAEPVYNGYYQGSDGYFYAKCIENAYGNYKYSNGTTAKQSSDSSVKYFKVEPIVWRALTTDYNSTGKALLLAEKELTANVPYYGSTSDRTLNDATIYANNYKYSNIRAYLNGKPNQFVEDGGTATSYDIDWTGKGFIDVAFTSTAKDLIATTTVDNSAESTTDAGNNLTKATTYACDKTEDKIFLLSEKEATTEGYGFAAYDAKGIGNSRIRVTTDYAKANYAEQNTTPGYGGWWWLRSPPYNRSDFARDININGSANSCPFVYREYGGVVPALCISAE
ncbi:MAG: hypothetical protein II821_04500 [Treponema sp.]|nr:hypothetical protein [Treponema sp.]